VAPIELVEDAQHALDALARFGGLGLGRGRSGSRLGLGRGGLGLDAGAFLGDRRARELALGAGTSAAAVLAAGAEAGPRCVRSKRKIRATSPRSRAIPSLRALMTGSTDAGRVARPQAPGVSRSRLRAGMRDCRVLRPNEDAP
jgi:hypothetical protein